MTDKYPHRNLHFFFQAEDGIRDATVTGVQTCALPIFARGGVPECKPARAPAGARAQTLGFEDRDSLFRCQAAQPRRDCKAGETASDDRSEERRVGKEWIRRLSK